MGDRSKKRIKWIDVCKGIGMILVILGHCAYFGGVLHNYIFTFHMPLFFLLSGLFFNANQIRNVVTRKAKSLILPYVSFSILGLIMTIAIPSWRNNYSLKGFIYDIYMGSPDYINVSSIWFLMCLFVTMLLMALILKIQSKKIQYIVLALLVLLGVGFAYIHEKIPYLPGRRLPFDIDVAMISVLFFGIGYYFKNSINKISSCNNFILIGIFACLSFALWGVVCINGRVNLHGLTFNNILLYVTGAILGSLMLMALSVIVSRVNMLEKMFAWIGRNTISILGLQAIYVRLFVLLINAIKKQSYQLYYLPSEYVLVSFVFVLIMSVITTIIFNPINRQVKNAIIKQKDSTKFNS